MPPVFRPKLLVAMLAAASLLACTGPGQATTTGDRPAGPAAPKTLVIILRQEPNTVAAGALFSAGTTTGTQRGTMNAGLTSTDGGNNPIPQLAEALPQLNTDSWRVFPDGRMETTYRLRPNLTWHDGAPLSAEDFVFAWQVYIAPEFGIATSRPQGLMDHVLAPDTRTLVVRWRSLYPEANRLTLNFAAVPRHILTQPFEDDRASLTNHPFWTTQFIGLGPYKLDRWEPGAFIEELAFDAYVWGRPKIDRLRLLFMPDANTALANLLSGEAHLPADDPIRVQQGVILAAEWGPKNAGTVVYRPTLWRMTQVQHRPEFANPVAVLDLRVRRALSHSIDKAAINDALFEGQGILSDSPVRPGVSYFADLDRAIVKYPYDLRQSEQYMADAGYRKGPGGFYLAPDGERPTFQVKVIASAQNDAERTIMADGWQRAGFAMEQESYPPAQAQSGEAAGTFRSLSNQSAGEVAQFTTANISRPENGWRGGNRGGWSNPEFDRLVDAFTTELNPAESTRLLVQAARLLSENLGSLPLYFTPSVLAYPSALTGISVPSPEAQMIWNIHEWELHPTR